MDLEYRLKLLAQKILQKCPGSSYSAVYASSPPCETIYIGKHISKALGIPLICDLRDPWTYSPSAKYRSYIDFLMERNLERLVLNSSSHVIANTYTARQQLIQMVGVRPEKISVIYNGYDNDKFLNEGNRSILDNDKFNITYTGLMSASSRDSYRNTKSVIKRLVGLDYTPVQLDHRTRSPMCFLAAIAKVIESEPSLTNILRFNLVGNFDKELIKEIDQFRYKSCVRIHGPMDQASANAICMNSDLLLLLQISSRIAGHSVCTAIPGKLFNYMRSGTWILAPMEENEAAQIVRKLGVGDIVEPWNVEGMANILRGHIEYWKGKGKKFSDAPRELLQAWDRRVLAGQLAEILANAAT